MSPRRKAPAFHPVADLFPMLADDELKDLAHDIAARGLLQPIVLDSDGRILDGRNRYAACELANVQPDYVTYDGDDPDGYALAVNLQRRNLSKGQQAMVAAQASCFMKQTEAARALKMSHDRVHRAKTVLDHAPDLADSVVSGATSLDDAYKTARDNKRARDDRETQMAMLRAEAPDLADLVTEERMSLSDALGSLRERQAQRESELRAATNNLKSVLLFLTSKSIQPEKLAEHYADVLDDFKTADLDYAARTMAAIADRSNHRG